mmetsp:Transcript_26864/g.66907  ORF Transcript_26864/g.66907 Transcript_26864/m.66907 type:complete len:400 (+) Transcript_26864:2433-3632(+)
MAVDEPRQILRAEVHARVRHAFVLLDVELGQHPALRQLAHLLAAQRTRLPNRTHMTLLSLGLVDSGHHGGICGPGSQSALPQAHAHASSGRGRSGHMDGHHDHLAPVCEILGGGAGEGLVTVGEGRLQCYHQAAHRRAGQGELVSNAFVGSECFGAVLYHELALGEVDAETGEALAVLTQQTLLVSLLVDEFLGLGRQLGRGQLGLMGTYLCVFGCHVLLVDDGVVAEGLSRALPLANAQLISAVDSVLECLLQPLNRVARRGEHVTLTWFDGLCFYDEVGALGLAVARRPGYHETSALLAVDRLETLNFLLCLEHLQCDVVERLGVELLPSHHQAVGLGRSPGRHQLTLTQLHAANTHSATATTIGLVRHRNQLPLPELHSCMGILCLLCLCVHLLEA